MGSGRILGFEIFRFMVRSFKSLPGAVATGVAICAFVLANCVRVPDADDFAKGPQVDEIVRRVKCDLYDAVADRLNRSYGYEWLHSWTVQANLNLIVNDLSQLSPGVTITQPLKAATIPLVVTNFGQSFNFGLGASWNNTATRNETVTFTVSLDELTTQFGKHPQNCDFPIGVDLQSELGLKEWISASLAPVEAGDLKVGYHKSPKAGAGATTAKDSATTAQKALGALNLRPPANTGGIHCDIPSTIPPRSSGPPSLASSWSDLAIVQCDIMLIYSPTAGFDFSKLEGGQVKFIAQTVMDIQRAIADLTYMHTSEAAKARAALEKTAIDLTVFVDPPIDTISHQVQFIIVWNASATPSWTLVNFKGPSPSSGALFSATKTKTHVLNVVIGPPSSSGRTRRTQCALNRHCGRQRD